MLCIPIKHYLQKQAAWLADSALDQCLKVPQRVVSVCNMAYEGPHLGTGAQMPILGLFQTVGLKHTRS